MKKPEIKKFMIIFIYIAILSVGIIIGMLLQQLIIQKTAIKIMNALDGSNIEINIDLNETQLVESAYELMGLEPVIEGEVVE